MLLWRGLLPSPILLHKMIKKGMVMDNLIQLLSEHTLASILIMLALFFLAFKEVWGAAEWIKGKLEVYRNRKNQTEDEKETIEDRLAKLERHDKWQYDALMEATRSLQAITNTLSDMQKKQEEATVATARSALYRLSQEILAKGYMSQIEYDCFKELYDVYIENHGNHSMKDKIAPKVFALEIKD